MCHSVHVALWGITLQPGQSLFDQIVFAAIKAILSGQFQPGQPFPSGRTLAAELKIHPNTAHKVIQYLIQERWLEASPGVGTVVAAPPEARRADRRRLLQQDVERLAVEAVRVGVELEDLIDALESSYQKLAGGVGSGSRVTRR
jgi:DNA-binding transcriptional regulator YhcF (GntR family)